MDKNSTIVYNQCQCINPCWNPVILMNKYIWILNLESSTIKSFHYYEPWFTICLILFEEKETVDVNTFILDLKTISSIANWIRNNYGFTFLWYFGSGANNLISESQNSCTRFIPVYVFVVSWHWNAETCNPHVAWWRHQMETFSALLAPCVGNSPGAVNSPHKGQWRRALMFSLICAWIND